MNIKNTIASISFMALVAVFAFGTPNVGLAAGCSTSNNPGNYNPWWCDYGNGVDPNDDDDDNGNGSDNDDLNVVTISAINVDEDSATLRGEITDIDSDEDYIRFFQWGTSSNDLNHTSTMSGTTDNEGTFSMTIYGLNDNDTYYFRACAENTDNSSDDDCGSTLHFTTDNDSSDDNDSDNDDDDNDSDSDYCDDAIVTTDATNVTATSATLNGVVTNNDGNNSTTVWFEYGPTVNLGYTTSTKTIYAHQSIVSTTVYGLAPGQAHFFRMRSNDCGNGDYKAFITNPATVTSTTGTITTNNNNSNNNNNNSNENTGEVLFETIQYLKVDLVPGAKDVRPGDKVAFEAVYENLSDKNLRDMILVVDFPKEMTVTDPGPGKLLSSQQVEVRIPVLPAYTKGSFGVTAQVGARTPDETFLVSVLSANFDHPVEENSRVETLNSAIIRVSSLAAPSQIAGVIAAGFFPTTFLGWIVLLAAIVLLIYISRKLYKEREEEKKKKAEAATAHHPELKIAK